MHPKIVRANCVTNYKADMPGLFFLPSLDKPTLLSVFLVSIMFLQETDGLGR